MNTLTALVLVVGSVVNVGKWQWLMPPIETAEQAACGVQVGGTLTVERVVEGLAAVRYGRGSELVREKDETQCEDGILLLIPVSELEVHEQYYEDYVERQKWKKENFGDLPLYKQE